MDSRALWLVTLLPMAVPAGLVAPPHRAPAEFILEQGGHSSFHYGGDTITVRYALRVRNVDERSGRVRCFAYLPGRSKPAEIGTRVVAPGERVVVRGSSELPLRISHHVLEDIEPRCE